MSKPETSIPRLKHDTQEIPQAVLDRATSAERTMFEWFEKQQARNNDVANVLNDQSEMLEKINKTIEPFAQAMGWWAVTRWLAIGFFSVVAALIGLLYTSIEAWKSWRGIP